MRLEVFLEYNPLECAKEIRKMIKPYNDKERKKALRKTQPLFIKVTASQLYALFSILCKKPLTECPVDFQRLIESLENKEYYQKNGKFDPLALTAYCIEKQYNLKPFDDLESFRVTYIQPFLKQARAILKEHPEALKESIKRLVNL